MTNTIGRVKIPVSAVNSRAGEDAAAFFAECDGRYEKQLSDIVERISSNISGSKLILLSGPSASGKTTSSLKIRQSLHNRGVDALALSMDDFFSNRDEAPILPNGERDLESLDALDLPYLKVCLTKLITEGRAELPSFNFKEGRRNPKLSPVELEPNSVAIVEGLHALDPRVTEGIPLDHILRIYVSVSSDFVDDAGQVCLSARDARLIRRMIRDYHFRGSSPENTLSMWDDVCRGEDRYVRPFKKLAEVKVNSAFACEPCLFAQSAIRLMEQVRPGTENYGSAKRILAALSGFERMPLELVPQSSVLREFVGGSEYFNKSGKIRKVEP